jgi:hypothetical protein
MRFMAGIYYDGQLQLNEYTVKVYMMTATEDPADHNVALNRIKHFVYNELESTIFVNSNDTEQCQKLVDAGLNITTMSTEPVDQVIGIMLFSKFAAITEGKLLIGEIELSSVLGDGVIYLHGENENVNDVEPPSWWSSCDLVHNDITETDKVVTMHKGSVWRELDLAWPDVEDISDYDEVEESGNTIVFANFRKSDDTK